MNNLNAHFSKTVLLAGVLCAILYLLAPTGWTEETTSGEGAGLTFDNLVPVDDPQVAMAYIDPDADFSVFKRGA